MGFLIALAAAASRSPRLLGLRRLGGDDVRRHAPEERKPDAELAGSQRHRGTSRTITRGLSVREQAWWKAAQSIGRRRSREEGVSARHSIQTSAISWGPSHRLHAYPFRIVQQADRVTIVLNTSVPSATSTDGNPHPHGHIDWYGHSRGRWGGLPCCKRDRSTTKPGSIAPGISTATPCTSSSVLLRPAPITCSMKPRSRTRRCSRGRGR